MKLLNTFYCQKKICPLREYASIHRTNIMNFITELYFPGTIYTKLCSIEKCNGIIYASSADLSNICNKHIKGKKRGHRKNTLHHIYLKEDKEWEGILRDVEKLDNEQKKNALIRKKEMLERQLDKKRKVTFGLEYENPDDIMRISSGTIESKTVDAIVADDVVADAIVVDAIVADDVSAFKPPGINTLIHYH